MYFTEPYLNTKQRNTTVHKWYYGLVNIRYHERLNFCSQMAVAHSHPCNRAAGLKIAGTSHNLQFGARNHGKKTMPYRYNINRIYRNTSQLRTHTQRLRRGWRRKPSRAKFFFFVFCHQTDSLSLRNRAHYIFHCMIDSVQWWSIFGILNSYQ